MGTVPGLINLIPLIELQLILVELYAFCFKLSEGSPILTVERLQRRIIIFVEWF